MYDSEFTYYEPEQIDDVLKQVIDRRNDKITYRKKQYYNIPCSFDIETTSTYLNGDKVAFMWIWVLNINGTSIIGRTWEQFEYCLQRIHEKLFTGSDRIFIIYVHNLNFEFSFIGRRFVWDKVFSIDTHEPIYARTVDGIEFRCSYLLSGYKLAKVAENLQTFKIRKLTGDLNYYLVRHSKTPAKQKEIRYLINDGRIVVMYIAEQIEKCGNIAKIPLTKTGFVRLAVRQNCFSKSHREKIGSEYRRMIKQLTITLDEYNLCKQAFAGGFVHANPWYTKKILHNVKSFDFCSSYPAVIVSELYPMSKGEHRPEITSEYDDEFNHDIYNYCCVFIAKITNLQSRVMFDNPISLSKCWDTSGTKINNGRVVSAKVIHIAMTNVDYMTYEKFYKWDKFEIRKFYRYKARYLPTRFVDSVLTFYEAKTSLKGVDGKETEYMSGKENVNSCYGMMVTDILRDLIMYDPERTNERGDIEPWFNKEINKQESIDKYNNNPFRFQFYIWGIFVTSYARRNVLSGVLACGNDYIYADTDSLKILNYEKHREYFKNYNDNIYKRLKKACDYHGFSYDRIAPLTAKSELKPLGIWEDETKKCKGGSYPCFSTLGAKRYMYLENGVLHTTVAGANKEMTAKYLTDKFGKYGAFYHFDETLSIPKSHSGRTTSCYIPHETSGTVTDYLGNSGTFHEMSSVHIEQTVYNLSLADDYIKYFLGVQQK